MKEYTIRMKQMFPEDTQCIAEILEILESVQRTGYNVLVKAVQLKFAFLFSKAAIENVIEELIKEKSINKFLQGSKHFLIINKTGHWFLDKTLPKYENSLIPANEILSSLGLNKSTNKSRLVESILTHPDYDVVYFKSRSGRMTEYIVRCNDQNFQLYKDLSGKLSLGELAYLKKLKEIGGFVGYRKDWKKLVKSIGLNASKSKKEIVSELEIFKEKIPEKYWHIINNTKILKFGKNIEKSIVELLRSQKRGFTFNELKTILRFQEDGTKMKLKNSMLKIKSIKFRFL